MGQDIIHERFEAGKICHCCHKRRGTGTHYLVLQSYGIDTRGVHVCMDCLRFRSRLMDRSSNEPWRAHCVCCPRGNVASITHVMEVSKAEGYQRISLFFCSSCRNDLLAEIPRTPDEAMKCLHSRRQIVLDAVKRLTGG